MHSQTPPCLQARAFTCVRACDCARCFQVNTEMTMMSCVCKIYVQVSPERKGSRILHVLIVMAVLLGGLSPGRASASRHTAIKSRIEKPTTNCQCSPTDGFPKKNRWPPVLHDTDARHGSTPGLASHWQANVRYVSTPARIVLTHRTL